MTPRDTTADERRITHRQRQILSLVAVVCILLAGAAVVTAQSGTQTIDDFEDGDIDIETNGWDGWSGDTDKFSTNSTALSGDFSGELTTAGSGSTSEIHASVSSGAGVVVDSVSTEVSIRRDGDSVATPFRWDVDGSHGDSLIQIEFNDDSSVDVVGGDGSQQVATWSEGQTHAVSLDNIDFNSRTADVRFDGSLVAEDVSLSESGSSLRRVSYNVDSAGGNNYVRIDDVSVTNPQNVPYGPRTIDFDSEPADEGVSDDLELVSGNPTELRVTDEVAYSDPNSFYATENSPDSAVILRIQSHPMTETRTDTVSARIAKTDDDFESGDDIISIRLFNDSQQIGFGGVGTDGDIFVGDGGTVVNTGDSVELGTFVRFRLTDIDPESDTYTVEWTADGQSGTESGLDLATDIGTGYDEVQIGIDESGRFDDFTVPAAQSVGVDPSDDLRLDVPKYLPHNESSHYAVEANESGTWVDVTDSATVTPGNTDALTFYPSNNTVVAGGNKSINERVNVTAEYQDLTATGSVVVATPTVDNLDLLPAWWSVNALLSDWTVIWILMATLIATAATRMATTFAGIGAFVMAMVMGWIMGDVPNGIMVATTFMGIFIGLNLAANIDYSVR